MTMQKWDLDESDSAILQVIEVFKIQRLYKTCTNDIIVRTYVTNKKITRIINSYFCP